MPSQCEQRHRSAAHLARKKPTALAFVPWGQFARFDHPRELLNLDGDGALDAVMESDVLEQGAGSVDVVPHLVGQDGVSA